MECEYDVVHVWTTGEQVVDLVGGSVTKVYKLEHLDDIEGPNTVKTVQGLHDVLNPFTLSFPDDESLAVAKYDAEEFGSDLMAGLYLYCLWHMLSFDTIWEALVANKERPAVDRSVTSVTSVA